MPEGYALKKLIEAIKQADKSSVSDEKIAETFLNILRENDEELVAILMIMAMYRPTAIKKLEEKCHEESEHPSTKEN